MTYPLIFGIPARFKQEFIFDFSGGYPPQIAGMTIRGRLYSCGWFKLRLILAERYHCNYYNYSALTIGGDYEFEERGEVEIKGKGMTKTYFLKGSR